MLSKKINKWRIAALAVFSVLLLCGFVPYTPDANTVLIDHFDGATSAGILAYSEDGVVCPPYGGTPKPSATPISAYVTGPSGLNQALSLNPPAGQPAGSGTYLQYPGGQLLSQPNGTIEFWTYLTTYGPGLTLVSQGRFPGACDGWTFGMNVTAAGQLQAGAWAAFSMNSGATTVPLNTWTHVAATWGSAGAKLYINGVLVGSDANTGMPASGYAGSVLVNYGAGVGTQIDELRISNIQRTSFTASGLAGTGTHNASGTYTWNATTGVTTVDWTSSDFTCDGPSLGPDPKPPTGVTITATTMTWANENMTWTRPSGTAGDIVGIWTSTDSSTGNSWTLTFNANGTLSLTGVITQCGGGGGGENPFANSQHWSNGYYVQLQYHDSPKTATAVSVTGPGIEGSKTLTYDSGMGSWTSWTLPSTPVSFGTTYPAGLPYTYTFMITDTTTWTATSTVSCFQAPFATNLAPIGPVTGTPTFSWTGIVDAGATYGVELHDNNGNRIWNSYGISGASIVYNGSPLTPGMTYNYNVVVESSSTCSSGASFAQGSFTYGTGATTISFNGWVKTFPSWPVTDGAAAATGATVKAYLSGAPPTLIGTVPVDATTSAFTLTSIPSAPSTFYLAVEPPSGGGSMPVLSKLMQSTANIQALLPFALFTSTQYASFNNTEGTGMILGRVTLKNSPATFLSGAIIEAREWTPGNPPILGATYPVTYTSGSSTQADGIYMVKNVPAGKLVQLVATLPNHTFEFNGAVIPVQTGFISEESFFATAVQQQSPFSVYSYHQDTSYFINLFVADPSHAFTGVTVNGPGLTGDVSLEYITARLRWELPVAVGISLGTTLPTGARTYNFTAATGGTPVTGSKTVSVYVEGFATNLLPTGNVATAPTFSWTGITGATGYGVMLDDTTAGTWVWSSPNLPGSQANILYNGPALTTGHIYQYTVISTINTDGNYNASFARAQFTYTGSGPSVTTYSSESAFTAAASNSTLIGFEDRDTSTGRVSFAGNEYAASGVTFSSPNSQPLWVYPPPTSIWTWPSKYLSPGNAPFEGGDSNEDSLTLTFSTPVAAVGWTFLDMPNPNVVTIRVYDQSNNLIHEALNGAGIVVGVDGTGFWGVVSPTPIARVEIIDTADNGDDVAYDNFRFAATVTPPTISFSSALTTFANDTPVGGATVAMVGNASITTTTATADGSFTLSGLPSGTEFSVIITGDTATYVPTYTAVQQSTTLLASARGFNLFTPADLTIWGVTGGNGAIRGRVMNSANALAGYVSGATVTYTSSLGRTDYIVKYEDNQGIFTTGTGTTANGKYYILNVVEGDTVTVSAARSNYTFPSRIFVTHAGAVSQGSISGNALPGRVAAGGHIMNTATPAVGIKNATIEQVGATAPINATTSNGDGFFYLSLPVTTTLQLKFSKPQATPPIAPTYSGNISFSADNLAIDGYNLFPATNLGTGNWNVTPGAGIIRGRVRDQVGNFIGGATVTAQSALHPATPYAVCYGDSGDPCTSTLTATDITTGRYVIKNVDDGDTVTVSAQMQGGSFNTLVFPTHGDSVHQGGITGTQTAPTTHPEAATIQARFEAAMAAFNANDFSDGSGFAFYISPSYLDRGENKATFVAEAQLERTAHGVKTWTIQSTLGSGNDAVMNILWNDGYIDTMYFRKEGGVWLLYGNQKLFDVWANSGHQMYSSNQYPYWVSLTVEDSALATITGVKVTGPNLPSGGIDLYHDTNNKQWHSWGSGSLESNLNPVWATAPALPLDYVFTISYTGGTGTSPEVQTFPVKSFVDVAPLQASLTPAASTTATRPLTFSWGSAGTGYRYRVEVSDANYNRIWETDEITGTSIAYGGPALGAGQYFYNLITEDGFGNMSMIQVPFQMPLLYPRTPVTSGTGVVDNHPAWSPDGTKIAFTSNRSGIDNIWVVNLIGTGLTQLTTATGNFDAKYPSWSPDGTKIAYILRDPNPNPEETSFSGYFLYTMNPDGSGQTRRPLPPRASQVQTDQFWLNEIWLTEWLDNDRIAFVSYGPEGGYPKIYVYSISNGTATQVSPLDETGMIYKISWNAATGKLAYDRWPIGVQTMTDTGANLQVVNIPRVGQMDTPAMAGWRPDGNQLAFVKNLYGESNIAIFDPAAGTALVEQTATDDEWPVWSPGGEAIAFVSNGKIWTMTIVVPAITVTGKVYNWAGTATLNGATVDLIGGESPRSATTDANGSFTFDNIPTNQGFYLRFRSTGLGDVYSGDMNFAGAVGPVDLGIYNLPADADMAGFGLLTGKGLIMGRVIDQQFGTGGRVGGAIVTATSAGHPAPGYTVTYRDPLGNLGGTATYGNGRYYVLNMDEGDRVTVTATKGNRPMAQRTFHTFGGAVSQGNVRNQAPAYDVSFSGTVYDIDGNPQGGATVEIDRYPAKNFTTDGTGAYLLGNLPRDVNMNLKITKDGFVPAYTGGFNLNANAAGIPLTLFTQANLTTNLGVAAGNGLIAGRVTDNTLSPLAGARIQALSNKGQTYTVQYGQGGGTATDAGGKFWIPNVVAGDVVTLTVAHPGYIYYGMTYLDGYANAVTEKLFVGVLRKGDINGDGKVDLTDAVLALKVAAGLNPTGAGIRTSYPTSGADVNGDGMVGAAEMIYILQYLAGLRP
jgi:hypothetical protein